MKSIVKSFGLLAITISSFAGGLSFALADESLPRVDFHKSCKIEMEVTEFRVKGTVSCDGIEMQKNPSLSDWEKHLKSNKFTVASTKSSTSVSRGDMGRTVITSVFINQDQKPY